ncbi:MAG: TraR/DksA C4-type zinc finger protein [Gammaproteobacteria bacterium AqS3]|nr:TraR/DksA C4-type zinc finger protein [Gammaproteobacteria bacterium AqS3]
MIKTREQLLASDPSEYMNQAQKNFFRSMLEKERDESLRDIEQAEIELKRARSNESDELDQALIEEEHRILARLVERKSNLLQKIDNALRRLSGQGDSPFGYCVRTGEEIGLERLLVRPTATLCIEEKRRAEKLERQRGGGRADF